ncbi:MAG TPA: T9SS type A sorting domain-containing protein, partial [Candidatus Eisenbacteria bacterium]|nr:T9SS type A sorting domain-containing protein [Candidatus Eisenbacteria bacterium]
GRFDITIGGENREILVPTDDMCEVSWIPRQGDLVSYLLPNPTSSSTSITVDIPKSYYDPSGGQEESAGPARLCSAPLVEVLTPVDIGVFNIRGQRLSTVYSGRLYGETRTFTWDGTDRRGMPVAPGVYFLRVVAGGRTAVKKVVVIR